MNLTPSDVPIAAFPGEGLSGGWLCFECDTEKRRLAPIPPEWEMCETCVLDEMCQRAGYVTRTPKGNESLTDQPRRPD